MQIDFENKNQSTYKLKKNSFVSIKIATIKKTKNINLHRFRKLKNKHENLTIEKKNELIRLNRIIKIIIIIKNVCANCFESNYFLIDKNKLCKN